MTSGVSLFNGRILSRVEPPSLLQLVAASLYLHSNNIAIKLILHKDKTKPAATRVIPALGLTYSGLQEKQEMYKLKS